MDQTANLPLPYIAAAQAQKHVTHNEALRILDTVVQLAVIDRDLASPPMNPAEGDRYIVAGGAVEAWAGHDQAVAAWQDGAWAFYPAKVGWCAWLVDEQVLVAWDGNAWIDAAGGETSTNPAAFVGVNATADATNRLSVKSDATLFSHDDVTPGTGDMRQVLNKAAAARTVSQLYQSNWSGRAETGLTGDDDFHVKVSPDGAVWHEAIVVDKDTGAVSFPSGSSGGSGSNAIVANHLARNVLKPELAGHRTDGLRLRKAIEDVRAGTRQSFRILPIGDSLSAFAHRTANDQLQRILAKHCANFPVYGYGAGRDYLDVDPSGEVAARAAHSTASGTTAEIVVKGEAGGVPVAGAFDVSWTGTYFDVGTGEVSYHSVGGDAVFADRLLVAVVTEPGAGTVQIDIADTASASNPPGETWRAPTVGEIASGHALTGGLLQVSADAARGASVVILDVTFAQYLVRVSHVSGAAVKVLRPMHEVRTLPAVNAWNHDANVGSNDFSNATVAAQDVMADVIAAYDPDVIVVDSDDRLAAYQNFVPKLEAAVTAAGLAHPPLVLLVGNPGYQNGAFVDADIAARIAYCHEFAATRVGWDVIDMMAFAGGLSEVTRAGWQGDNIHLAETVYEAATRAWALKRGYMALQEQTPGGDASRADVVTLNNGRNLSALHLAALAAHPGVHDTGWMTWAFNVEGGAAGEVRASGLWCNLGSAAGSKIAAYVNEALPSFMGRNYYRGATPGAMGALINVEKNGAPGLARIIWTSDRGWNAAHTGAMTGRGFGFKLENDALYGIAALNNVEQTTTLSAGVETTGTRHWHSLLAVLEPRTVNAETGTVHFFVDHQPIGSLSYSHGSPHYALRVEGETLAGGSTFRFFVRPPKIAIAA